MNYTIIVCFFSRSSRGQAVLTKHGEEAELGWTISRAGKAVASGKLPAQRAKALYYLPLPGQGLPPGDCQVAVKYKNQGPPAETLRVVASPWQEGSK